MTQISDTCWFITKKLIFQQLAEAPQLQSQSKLSPNAFFTAAQCEQSLQIWPEYQNVFWRNSWQTYYNVTDLFTSNMYVIELSGFTMHWIPPTPPNGHSFTLITSWLYLVLGVSGDQTTSTKLCVKNYNANRPNSLYAQMVLVDLCNMLIARFLINLKFIYKKGIVRIISQYVKWTFLILPPISMLPNLQPDNFEFLLQTPNNIWLSVLLDIKP